MKHELVILADKIDWHTFERKFGSYYVDKKGRSGAPIRLMVGLHYLKSAFNESDESAVYRFFENPYWQYFCGYEYFQTSFPIDPSSLTRFRKRIGSEGVGHFLIAKKALSRQNGYSRARQMRRAAKMTRKLKTYLGCVHRDIVRKAETVNPELMDLLEKSSRLQQQTRDSKNKLYSIHAPEVECISKGKAHKRYEFGCKVSLATSSKDNWILGIQAHHGNPYDGHTLKAALEQVERLTDWSVKETYVDLGYRGHDYTGEAKVHIVNFRSMSKKTRSVKRWLKRRSAIEPVIGHVKSDNGMDKNRLKGTEGDKINALLSGCGFSMRKLLKVFLLPIIYWLNIMEIFEENSNRTKQFA